MQNLPKPQRPCFILISIPQRCVLISWYYILQSVSNSLYIVFNIPLSPWVSWCVLVHKNSVLTKHMIPVIGRVLTQDLPMRGLRVLSATCTGSSTSETSPEGIGCHCCSASLSMKLKPHLCYLSIEIHDLLHQLVWFQRLAQFAFCELAILSPRLHLLHLVLLQGKLLSRLPWGEGGGHHGKPHWSNQVRRLCLMCIQGLLLMVFSNVSPLMKMHWGRESSLADGA